MPVIDIFKAAIFDMDGLMFDTEPIYNQSWLEAAGELGFALEDQFFAQVQGRNNIDAEAILVQNTAPDFNLSKFRTIWPKKWFSIGKERGIRLKKGLIPLLELLKKEEVLIGLATSSNREIMDFCLDMTGLRETFSVAVCGQDVNKGKPRPDIYLHTANLLGVRPRDCMVLEDSNSGAQAGINAGMKVFLIPDLIKPQEETMRQVYFSGKNLLDVINFLMNPNIKMNPH